MTTASESLSLDAARQSMDVLAEHLDAFVQAWESSQEPPALGPFLPERGEIRRLTLVELIKVDLEYRWLNRRCPKRILEYVADFPELATDRVPCDLIYEEFHIRKQSGENVTPEEYLQAFPGQTAEIASILGIEQDYESSSFYRRNREKQLIDVVAGDTIDDFDLLTELGAGAFAKVFLARQKSMQRLVALKISRDQSTEPQTLAQLDHDHIVRVFDQRILPDRMLRLLYMQYVAGGTLQGVVQRVRQTPPEKRSGKLLLDVIDEILEQRGESRPLESSLRRWLVSATWPEAVCWLGARLARALDYAHQRGVLHRDVKPANVLVTAECSPKLADFNISFNAKATGATPAAYFGGSLAYMSPEQLEACDPAHPRSPEDLDGRSDFYALGVVLWELLAGFRPFPDEEVSGGWGTTLNGMVARRTAGVDASDLAHLPGCPAGLPAAMQTTLAPDREDRWSSGHEMARRLELCTNPKVCELLFPPKKSLRVQSRVLSVAIICLLAGVPNILAGAFNYIHNLIEIVAEIGHSLAAFERIQTVINVVAYPVGCTLFWYLALSVRREMNDRSPRDAASIDRRRRLRHRCLQMGTLVAMISVAEWSIAACAYPLSLRLIHANMPMAAMLHFLFSLLLCGLVAAAYPFFAITFFSLRCLYPVFLLRDADDAAFDAPVLAQIRRWGWIFIVVAALAPMLAISALILATHMDALPDDGQKSMGVFLGVGLLGLPLVLWLFNLIQRDLDTFGGVIGTDRERSHR